MKYRMFLLLPFDIIIIKENSDVHFEYENLHHTFFGTIQILYNFYGVIITLTICSTPIPFTGTCSITIYIYTTCSIIFTWIVITWWNYKFKENKKHKSVMGTFIKYSNIKYMKMFLCLYKIIYYGLLKCYTFIRRPAEYIRLKTNESKCH